MNPIVEDKSMACNVEIKARVENLARLRELALPLGNNTEKLINQKDTFYNASEGRLKLREFGDGTGQLIAYSRPDSEGPKTSDYVLSSTDDPESLHKALARSVGIRGVVIKERTLILADRTRIHLDRVANLGDFMELEVVLKENETEEEGMVVAQNLMRVLEISTDDLVSGAYIDHIEAKGTSAEPS
ncbi:MAG: adenylate cyclase class IV [Candidatus Krumholzibacteriia bacterium]|jgi:adenylate cyclase class IV